MTDQGRQALARLLTRFAHATGAQLPHGVELEVTDEMWTEFREAVREAQAQLREEDSAGVRRWQEARHLGEKA